MPTQTGRTAANMLRHPCGRLRVDSEWGRDREASQSLRDHELWWVWAGRGWMRTHRGRFALRPGFCCWMRPGGVYDAGVQEGDELGFTYLHFEPGSDMPDDPPEFFRLRDVGYFESVFRRIVEHCPPSPRARWGRSMRAPAAAEALLRAVLAELMDLPEALPDDERDPVDSKLQELAAGLADPSAPAASVAAMAKHMRLSEAHFRRRFKAVVGLSPKQYMLARKMDQARHLLSESSLNVSRIAEALGYSDIYFFSKQFKQYTGQTCTEFRAGATGAD